MVIIQKPNKMENYVKVGAKLNYKLQQQGYQPAYFDGEHWYYAKTNDILRLTLFRKFVG